MGEFSLESAKAILESMANAKSEKLAIERVWNEITRLRAQVKLQNEILNHIDELVEQALKEE